MAWNSFKDESGGAEIDLNSGGDHVENSEGVGAGLGGIGSAGDGTSGDLKPEMDAVGTGIEEQSADVSVFVTREVAEVETVVIGNDTQVVEDDEIGGGDEGNQVGGQDEGSGSGEDAVVEADTAAKDSDKSGLTTGAQDKGYSYVGDDDNMVEGVAFSREMGSEGITDMTVQVADAQQVDLDAVGEADIDVGGQVAESMHRDKEPVDEDADVKIVDMEVEVADTQQIYFDGMGEAEIDAGGQVVEMMLGDTEPIDEDSGEELGESEEFTVGSQEVEAIHELDGVGQTSVLRVGVEKDEDSYGEQMMQAGERPRQKRGRPPKKNVVKKDVKDEDRDGEQMMQSEEKPRRKRGRPPKKNVVENHEKGEGRNGEQTTKSEQKLRRKRGRPPKNHVVEKYEEDEDSDEELRIQDEEKPQRKRGRPPGKDVNVERGASLVEDVPHARYDLPTQEGKIGFSASDLVWGKVRSHPWWPGQIYDSSDASKMALEHHTKDNFLVAYFGDKTFAWCDESQLKPFQVYFSQMEKQSNMDAFLDAVDDILDEVCRRVGLGMTCSCMPEDAYRDIKHQKVENAGIREGTNCCSVDSTLIAGSFQPEKLLEYVKVLAEMPSAGADRLELLTAKAQLKAFYRSKGCPELPEFQIGGGFDDEVSPTGTKPSERGTGDLPNPTLSDMISRKGTSRGKGRPLKKEKHIKEDSKKKKSLTELMEDTTVAHTSDDSETGTTEKVAAKSASNSSGLGRKQIVAEVDSSGYRRGKRKSLDSLGDVVVESSPSSLKTSFKFGDRIRRVASQLTGSSPIPKSNGETFQSVSKRNRRKVGSSDADSSDHASVGAGRKKISAPKNYSSPDEMLSQLLLAARDPMKSYSFLSTIISFFTDFRDSLLVISSEDKKSVGKNAGKRSEKRSAKTESGSSETSTPDYMQDSYWSDMFIQQNAGDELLSNSRKRKGESLMQGKKKKNMSAGDNLPVSLTSVPVLVDAQQLQVGSTVLEQDREPDRPAGGSGKNLEAESSPTALILNFNESNALPSETDLIRIFSGYGPLMEAETEVLKKAKRAKVVFKNRTDAEIAFSSAGKFSLFGPALLSYRLRFLPPTSRTSPDTTQKGKKDSPVECANSEVSPREEAAGISDNAREVSDVDQVQDVGTSDNVQVVSVGAQVDAAVVSDNAQEAPAQEEAVVPSDTGPVEALDNHTAAVADQVSDPALAEAIDKQ